MENEETVPVPAEARLVAELADPAGPPKPATIDETLNGIAVFGVILVAVGGLLLPICATTTRTCGATRSAKLQWEQRQQEIEQAVQADEARQGASHDRASR